MRKDRIIKEKDHDPYLEQKKYVDGTHCPECHAVMSGSRWVWPGEQQSTGEPRLCPACRRVRDDFPAGEVHLSGTYLVQHRDEILNLIQNIVREEESRSPLKRLMNVSEETQGLCVRLTDDHLARRIAESIHKAYSGEMQLKYSEEAKFVRLYWHRDE